MAGNKFDDSSDPAFEDALLAAAAVAAPPVAAAAAVIETGKDAVEFAGNAAGEVAGAVEDLFGGGDEVPPGTSTFPVDPNAPAPTETAEEANARGDAIRAQQEHFDERGGGGGWVFNADDERHGSFDDSRQEDVSDHDVHTQADPYLDLDTGIAGAGAAGANAVTAPDGAFEPVGASDPYTSVGGVDAGAPDGVFEPVSESDLHTSVAGAVAGAPDGVFEPVSASEPHTGVGFMPEPSVDSGAPDGAFEPVSESDLHTTVAAGDAGAPDGVFEPVSASDPHTGVGFIPDGTDMGAPDGVFEPVSESDPRTSVGGDAGAPDGVFEPVSESDPHTSVGGDAGAPDGVFEPVSVSDPHTSVGFVPVADDLPTVDGVQTEVPFGSDVQLNPQPIPPGMGADIGEPVTEAATSAVPDVADSSIIIVGGSEAAVGADLGGGGDPVSLNPQPIPPGVDLHPPSAIAEAGADVSLNPQPIPPGIGADIGEPVAESAAAAGAPSATDSSIVAVSGAEAPVVSEVPSAPAEAPVVADVELPDAPMEDVASTIAVDMDGPAFSAADSGGAPPEVGIAEESLDG